jgi:orotate phosphoribosyltransferase
MALLMLDQQGWIREYQGRGALWMHDGNASHPHALLTSGKHSNGFFNSRLVTGLGDEPLLRAATSDLFQNFRLAGGPLAKVEVVVGPQTGATRLADFLATQFAFVGGRVGHVTSASPAKSGDEGNKRMVFSDRELGLIAGKHVLLCEDVLTTGGSVELTASAVIEAGGVVLPFVAALVNRSGQKELGGKKIVALINREMHNWDPDDCPLCKGGSKAIRPKDNWRELTKGS